jgi:transposase
VPQFMPIVSYRWFQSHPVFNEQRRRLDGYSFVEDLLGIRSHGKALKQWVNQDEGSGAGPSSSARGGRREEHVKIDDEIAEQILELLESEPTLTLSEISEYLLYSTGVEVVDSTIGKFLHRQNPPYSRKKLSYSNTDVDPAQVFELHAVFNDPHPQ